MKFSFARDGPIKVGPFLFYSSPLGGGVGVGLFASYRFLGCLNYCVYSHSVVLN